MKITHFLRIAAVSVGLLFGARAMAQDDEPLPDDTPSEQVDTTTPPPAPAPDTSLPQEKHHRPIKTLEKKTFLKIGRYEASPHLGFVTNDPFINRYLLGASFAYHVTEIFALELTGTFSPDFGTGDWKSVTHQLVEQNRVSPDISKIQYFGSFNFQYSPIYGKVAVGKKIINFDIFGSFGTGVVNTKDDLDALQCADNPDCINTQSQFHPTTNFGGGFRVIFGQNVAVRLEGRSMIYIETIQSTTLEMKNNFYVLASASFFFPNMQ